MWDDNHAPYLASTKSMAMPRQAIIQKKETPLHSDLGSRTIIPAKKQNDTTNKIIAICHIPNCPLLWFCWTICFPTALLYHMSSHKTLQSGDILITIL